MRICTGVALVVALAAGSVSLGSDSEKEARDRKIARLIGQLGDDEFETREEASQALAALGEAALPALGKAVKSDDLEVRRRAAKLIGSLGAVTSGGRVYKFYPEQLSWHDARKKCESLGGRLAVVKDRETNDLLTNLVLEAKKQEAWLGATDEKEEGKWVWVDGSEMEYKNWYDYQPNNKNNEEHYLLLYAAQKGRWCDQPNEAQAQHKPGFLCEWGK